MAATAYASSVSLLNTIDQIHTHPLVSTFFDKNQIQSLSKKVDFLVDFLEKHSDAVNREVEDLVRRIGDAAHEAEDTIEVYVANRILGRGESLSILPQMEIIIEQMESLSIEEVEFEKWWNDEATTMVGFDDSVHELLDELIVGGFGYKAEDEYSDANSREVEDLDLVCQIGDAAHEAEDKIEVYVADRVRGRGESLSILPKMEMIIEEMESIKEEVIKVKGEIAKRPSFLSDMLPSSSSPAPPPPTAAVPTTMVGFDDYMHKLWDELLGHDVERKIISITGMGGIGKTTLARHLYEDSLVAKHFNVRAWVTVSQDSSTRRVFMQALSCLVGRSTDRDGVEDQQLSDELYKALFNRRYLIVLDDTWSVEIWDKIKFFFPENKNGSRIIVTTRESKLVDRIGSSALAIELLGEENSWKLFCEKTFPKQNFPLELEGVGKKIVKKCGGHPLAITVMGGLLGKSPRTQKYWEKVAKDRMLILNSAENKPLSILYLSYKYLPVYLKPCFLYFGLYREDHDIYMKPLIDLWVAEGFIKSSRSQSLEEVAESYFYDLVDRNLILVPNLYYFSIHDLVRDLCLKVGEQENFYYVGRSIDGDHHFITDETTARRFYPQESRAHKTPSILYPLIVPAGEKAAPYKTRLLRVYYCEKRSKSPYYDAREEVNMRLLLHRSSGVDEDDYLLPLLLYRFWCLQTLDIDPSEMFVGMTDIWLMPQLRHIDIEYVHLPPPPPLSDDKVCVLRNLHSLNRVTDLIFTEELCKRIPNIKQLRILITQSQCYHLENLCSFNKLESFVFKSWVKDGGDLSRIIKFPTALKELDYNGYVREWSFMAVIASLPHLQCLRIHGETVATTEWIFDDEKFVSLKDLSFIVCESVTKWSAQSSNFPVLETLFMSGFSQLDKIPSGIGEIPTLRKIQLVACSESTNISAVEILHEQQSFENWGLRVLIDTHGSAELREKIQELGLTCQNLVIKSFR